MLGGSGWRRFSLATLGDYIYIYKISFKLVLSFAFNKCTNQKRKDSYFGGQIRMNGIKFICRKKFVYISKERWPPPLQSYASCSIKTWKVNTDFLTLGRLSARMVN